MRVALISDIHSNLQAWNAVLLDIRSQGIEKIICLGDIVGYGPNPAEVLKSVHTNVDYFVLGNHDAVICDKLDPSLFNDAARDLIQWTRSQLGEKAVEFLRTFPLSLDADAFRCVHGDFEDPASFNYISEPDDAAASWRAVENNLLFAGHTHTPCIWVPGEHGRPEQLKPEDFEVESGRRYIVNVGSVGQPRDGDARASYCIYNNRSRTVSWRRIPFDLDAYRSALKSCGVSETPSYFLRHDPRRGVPPLRELTSFTPPTTPDMAARDVVEIQESHELLRKISKWKGLTVAAVITALTTSAVALFLLTRAPQTLPPQPDMRLEIPAAETNALDSSGADEEENLLPRPLASVEPGAAIPLWNIHLTDRTKQVISVVPGEQARCDISMQSSDPAADISISSVEIRVRPGTKFCLEGLFRKSESFSGAVFAEVSLTSSTGGTNTVFDHFIVKEPRNLKSGGWLSLKHTFTVPRNGSSVRVLVTGRFSGTVLVRDLELYRTKAAHKESSN